MSLSPPPYNENRSSPAIRAYNLPGALTRRLLMTVQGAFRGLSKALFGGLWLRLDSFAGVW
jgi:hypothetical protein